MSTIKAKFKKAQVGDSGAATLQFDVRTSADSFADVIAQVGEQVDLTIERRQKDLPIVYEAVDGTQDGDVETVEAQCWCERYDAIADERGLPGNV